MITFQRRELNILKEYHQHHQLMNFESLSLNELQYMKKVIFERIEREKKERKRRKQRKKKEIDF